MAVVLLPSLMSTQQENFRSFMPSLETLERQKQLEATERQRQEAAKEAERLAKEHNAPRPKSMRFETEGEFRDRHLQKMFDRMELRPNIDLPIPNNYFDHMPDEEQHQLKFASST